MFCCITNKYFYLCSILYKCLHIKRRIEKCFVNLPLKCLGQHTNSTPLNNDMPQGSSMANDLNCNPLSWQAVAAVTFHLPKGQQLLWLWIWSKTQFSGTKSASDWKGPSVKIDIFDNKIMKYNFQCDSDRRVNKTSFPD